ncbi:uncharacterized protein LOC108179085 [Tachysurus ichikawai]
MADQEDCDSEAVKIQQQVSPEEKTPDTSPQDSSTSQAAKEESLRKSQRVRKLTEKGQTLHEEKANKLKICFKASYDEWKVTAKQVKGALEAPVSTRLYDHLVRIQYTSAEVKQAYDKLRSNP